MTNYDKLKQEFMKNPEFVEAYGVAWLKRLINERLESLKANIIKGESTEFLLQQIDHIRDDIEQKTVEAAS